MTDPFDLIVRNATLVTPGGRGDLDIGMRGGRVAAIVARGELAAAAVEELDGGGLYVLPGIIDGHVHFREPGLEHEETWLTGTRAAVFGGVTTVLDMPNTLPPTDSTERTQAKLGLAQAAAYCDFGLFGLLGPSPESVHEIARSGLLVGLKVFLGPTTGGLSAPDDDGLLRALATARVAGLRVAFHAEDRSIIETNDARVRSLGRTDARAHLESRPVQAEVAGIDRAGRLLREARASGHVLHLSSAEGLAAVERWRRDGVDLTCEATPHHMLLDRDAYDAVAGVARVNPPIRGEPDSSALLAALAEGRIDAIASDHAPHLGADKVRASIWDVPSGFAGVETLLPLMLTCVHDGRISLERLVHATSEAPAKTWRLWPRKGSITVGADADLTLVDLERPGVVRPANLHGKNNLSPFEGRTTVGAVAATVVRGRIVVRDGALVGEPGWGQLVSSSSRRTAP